METVAASDVTATPSYHIVLAPAAGKGLGKGGAPAPAPAPAPAVRQEAFPVLHLDARNEIPNNLQDTINR
jgi:hypothetical protein